MQPDHRHCLPTILVLSMLSVAWCVPIRAEAGVFARARLAGIRRQAATLKVHPSPRQDAPTVVAASSPFQRFQGELTPLEVALFLDAADGRLDEHTLLGAALIAGGTDDPRRLADYQARLDGLVDELRRSGKVTGAPPRRARAIFEFMHGRVLCGGYQLSASDLAVVLDGGRFNCVSASVLFNCLAERFGLETCGLEIPGHAMSRVILADGVLDIETTCPRWFELTDDPKRQADLVAETTGFRHAETTALRREVSGSGLVATIYYNRGVDLLAEEQFVEALAANAKALLLDPTSATARGNLLATLNNWSIDLGRKGRFAEAIARLEDGLALDPNYETFHVNYVHVHHRWAEQLCREERFEEALALVAGAAERQPQAVRCYEEQFRVYRRWAAALLFAGRHDEAFALFAEAQRRHGDCRRLAEAEIAAVNDHALALAEEGQFEEALLLLDRALAEQPGSALLAGNRRAAAMRWAEPAFQRGDYAEAILRTTRGATPGTLHETLLENVCYGYHQWITGLTTEGRLEEAEAVRRQAMADPFLEGRRGWAIPRPPTQ